MKYQNTLLHFKEIMLERKENLNKKAMNLSLQVMTKKIINNNQLQKN